MNGRIAWFVAGSVAGVYASVKARRAAYRMSMPGLIDQAAALGEGVRAFSAEVRGGMQERTAELERELGAAHDPPPRPYVVPPLSGDEPDHHVLEATLTNQKDHRPS